MCARWRDGTGPNELKSVIHQLSTTRSLTGGRFSIDSFEHFELTAIIAEAIEIHPLISPSRWHDLIEIAINKACEKHLDGKSLIEAAKLIEKQELKKPIKKFTFVSCWSMKAHPIFSAKKIADRLVVESSSRIRQLDKKLNHQQAYHFETVKMPTDYATISVAVDARDLIDAGYFGNRYTEIIRAAINLTNNLTKGGMLIESGRTKPINEVLPGPYAQVLDDADTPLDAIWIEYEYQAPRRLFSVRKDREKWFNLNAGHVVKRLFSHEYLGNDLLLLQDAFVEYVAALDHVDRSTSFLKLWQVLEKLALPPSSSDRYDVLVKRVVSLHKEKDVTHEMLNHLRRCRNNLVHQGKAPGDRTAALFLLKQFVERVMLYHLNNPLKCSSMTAAREVLDLPMEAEELNQAKQALLSRVKLISKAIKWKTPKAKASE